MKKRETLFKERVLKDFKKLPKTWAVKIQQVARCGDPDILFCCHGHFGALELKSDEGEAEPLQNYKLDLIEKAGGYARVVYPAEWPDVLAEITDRFIRKRGRV